MTSFDVTNGVNFLQNQSRFLTSQISDHSSWISLQTPKIQTPSLVLQWNESLQFWLARANLAPTTTSRFLYYFHLWIYQIYLWLQPSKHTILPSWMQSYLWVSLPYTSPLMDPVFYAGYLYLQSALPSNSMTLQELQDLWNTSHTSSSFLLSSPLALWIESITQSFFYKTQEDGSQSSTNDTFPSPYIPPVSPANGEWRPIRVPNGTFTNSWNIPWVNDSDPTTYSTQSFATPQWGGVKGYEWHRTNGENYPSFVQSVLNVYLPEIQDPDKLNNQMNQVLNMQETMNTRDQAIAEFWEDGSQTAKPCGKWNWLVRAYSRASGYTEVQNLEVLFGLNACMANAFIIAWDIKRTYLGERPVSYLRRELTSMFSGWRGKTMGIGTIDPTQPNESFLPYQEPTFVTPPFPGFISGHSTISSAAATFLTMYTKNENMSKLQIQIVAQDRTVKQGTMTTFGRFIFEKQQLQYANGTTDVILMWPTWKDAADEAGMSRLKGGIHILADHQAAVEIGEWIAQQTYSYFK